MNVTIDEARTHHDARRTVASRRTTGSSRSDQAVLRHLRVELYKERHHSDNAPNAKQPTDQPPTR